MNESAVAVEIPELAEGVDVEVKKAAGRDGRGAVPKSFFESYSAMANTYGGTVYLGIEQRGEAFFATGISEAAAVRKALWDGLNNPQQVNRNLLRDEHVTVQTLGGQPVLRVTVPRAPRAQRPIYVRTNPLGGTYKRNYEGDYRCDDETVRRMLAEQLDDSRDQRILSGFGHEDLDTASLKHYRQRFAVRHIDHPWSPIEDDEFLRNMGGWRRDRTSGEEGLTLAGLLMFGKWRSIRDELPNYFLDYQEQASDDPDVRWTDRVVPDGTWSGNVYDFYRIVMPKLTQGLKVPFRLEGGTERVDESLVHEALREALVNALIHADYTGRSSLRVIKRPHMFEFRNPGLMRISIEEALEGGHSDCRNRNLQKMFQMVGLGDQAGSGIPKVYRGWRQQDWRQPELEESSSPSEHTVLRLRMVSLFPEDVVREVEQRFGDRFRRLDELGRLALITVATDGEATHARIKRLTDAHARDVTLCLVALVRQGLLESEGNARNTTYRLIADGAEETGIASDILANSGPSSPTREESSPISASSSPTNDGNTGGDGDGLDEELVAIAARVANTRRASPETVRDVIYDLCQERWLTLQQLEQLLGRRRRSLREKYLTAMVREGRLEQRYPERPQDPRQAYRAVQETRP